jgi:hypothetical protein
MLGFMRLTFYILIFFQGCGCESSKYGCCIDGSYATGELVFASALVLKKEIYVSSVSMLCAQINKYIFV